MFELKPSTLEHLKCSKCNAYLSCSPITITSSGENICGRCQVNKQEINSTRNIVYEEIASEIIFPCRYRREGCDKKLSWNQVQNHEEFCDFRVYNCPVIPVGSCKWEGPNSRLLEHFKNQHLDLILEHPYKLYPDLKQDGEENFLMPAFGFLFLVQIKLKPSSDKLICCVRYLGNDSFISNFEFTLEVRDYTNLMQKSKKVTSRNKLMMNVCNSIEVNLNTITDFMEELEKIYLVISVNRKSNICFKCKKDLDKAGDNEFYCVKCGNTNMDTEYYTHRFRMQK